MNGLNDIQLTNRLASCLLNPLEIEDSNIQEDVKTAVEGQKHDFITIKKQQTLFMAQDPLIESHMQEIVEFSNSNSKETNIFEEKLGNTISNKIQLHLTKSESDEHTTSEIIETLDNDQYNRHDFEGKRLDENKDDVKASKYIN